MWKRIYFLPEICVTCELAHGSPKPTLVFILAEVVTVSHFIGGRWINDTELRQWPGYCSFKVYQNIKAVCIYHSGMQSIEVGS